MASNKSAILFILAVFLPFLVVAPTPPTICSTFCNTANCDGWESYECCKATDQPGCSSSCYTGWSWIAADQLCGFNVGSGKAIMDYSDDAGGNAYIVNPPATASTCTGTSVTFYGDFLAGTTYNLNLDFGTYLPHYAFDLYVNVILVDVNAGGSLKWDSSPKITATYTATGEQ